MIADLVKALEIRLDALDTWRARDPKKYTVAARVEDVLRVFLGRKVGE